MIRTCSWLGAILASGTILIQASAHALEPAGPRPIPVDGAVMTFDTSDPDRACQEYQDYVSGHQDRIDPELRDALESQICDPSEPGMVSVIILSDGTAGGKPKEDEKKSDPITIDVSASAGFRHGNENYGEINGRFGLTHKVSEHSELTYGVEGGYRGAEDVDNTRLVVTAGYKHQISDHWALFSFATFKHDTAQNIDYSTEELLGIMYNIFPFAAPTDLKFSVGVGHLFENLSDDTYRNDAIMKWRVKYAQEITKRLQVMATLWYMHSAYSNRSDLPETWFDFADHRVLFDVSLKLKNAIAEGVHVTFTFQDEYRSRPVDGAKPNDIRILFGIEGKFGF